MRSAMIIGSFLYGRGGSRSVGEDVAIHLRQRGWRILLLSHARSIFIRVLQTLWGILRHAASCSAAMIEVYSGNGFWVAYSSAWLLRLVGKHGILVLHGGGLPAFARDHPIQVGNLLREARAVVAPSEYLAREFRPVRPDIQIIGNGIDMAAYTFALRSRLRPILVWLRAFHEIYDPSLAIEVLRLVRRTNAGASLIMVGPVKSAQSMNEVYRLIQEGGLEDAVTVIGPVEKSTVGYWLAQGDVFLNTSRVDNTPVSVLEAMACGLCVVSTDVGGIPQIIRDRENGCLAPARDASAMADAVRLLLSDPDLARRVSAAGRATAAAYDWAEIMPKWELLLESSAPIAPTEG